MSEIEKPISEITLRDYFAAQAIPGLMSQFWGDAPALAGFAYQIADAMMRRREMIGK